MDDSLDCFEEKLKVKKLFSIKTDACEPTQKGTSKRKKLGSRTKKNSNKSSHSTKTRNEIVDNKVHNTEKVVSKYFKNYKKYQTADVSQICVENRPKEDIISSENDKENCEPVIKCEENEGLPVFIVQDFVKREENVQLECQEAKVQEGMKENTLFIKIEMDPLEYEKHDDEQHNVIHSVECPVCSNMVEEHLHAQHVRDCFINKFERSTGFCELCRKDISHMNQQRQLQHVNHCLDRQKQMVDQPGPNQFCPICGACSRTEDQRILHLKRCGRKLGIEPRKLMEASKLLEKQLAERKALGLPAVPLRASRTSPKKRRFATVPQNSAEADIQMALALSASLEKEDEWPALIPPVRGNRRKKVTRLPDCLLPLVLQTETDRLKLLEEKVAALIFPSLQENTNPKHEHSFDDGKEVVANLILWTQTCTLERDTDNFYLAELQDFITPKVSKNLSSVSSCTILDNPSEEIVAKDVLCNEDKSTMSSSKAEGFYAVESDINESIGDTPRTLACDMKKLLGNPYLSDLMIHTLDGSIAAHKLILSARCPQALKPDDSVQELQWVDVPSSAVFAFLECIYTGVFICKNLGDEKHQVLKLAYKYRVQELFHEYQGIDVQEKDGEMLEKEAIQEACEYTQFRKHQSEVKPHSTGCILSDVGIVDQLINEDDVEQVYMYMSQQQNTHKSFRRANQPQTHFSEEELPSIERPSSPDLFDIDDDPVSPFEELEVSCYEPKIKDVFDYSFTEALASSSPVKTLNKTCALSENFAKSPLKKGSELNVIASQNKDIRSNVFTPTKVVLNFPKQEPSCFESKATEHSVRQSLKFSSRPTPLQSKLICGSEMKNDVGILRSPISEKTVGLSPKHDDFGPDVYKKSSSSPMKIERKRSLEDCEWKTPKRRSYDNQVSPKLQLSSSPKVSPKLQSSSSAKRNDSLPIYDPSIGDAFEDECCLEMVETPKISSKLQLSSSQKGKNLLLDPDICAAFEDDCCLEMVETPTSLSPRKIVDNLSCDQSSRNAKHHSDVGLQYFTQKPGIHNRTYLSFLTQPDPFRISGSEKIATPKPKYDPKQILHKKVYDQVTPLPDYRKMITPELKEALKKYGVRKLPRSKAVILLNHIYELTHPWHEESEEPSTSKLRSPKIGLKQAKASDEKKEKTSKCRKEKTRTKKITIISKATTRTRVIKEKTETRKEFKTLNKSQDELSSSQNSSISDMPEESIGEVIAAGLDMKESIKKYICADSKLYEKILLYEPIPVNDLHKELKHNKIAITMPQLMDFLDEECITFSLPRADNYKKKQQARSQRFRKKVLSKLST